MRFARWLLAWVIVGGLASAQAYASEQRDSEQRASEQQASAQAKATTRPIDAEHSEVEFTLRVWFRKLHGRFLSLRGEVQTSANGEHASIRVEVDSQSVWMAKESNAEYARSEAFFDAEHHPHIRFSAQQVPMSLFRDGGELHGEIELRGITRPIRLRVPAARCARPAIDCDVHAYGEVSRSEFGMNSRKLLVGDTVELHMRIRLRDALE